jgi:hypothetical protein
VRIGCSISVVQFRPAPAAEAAPTGDPHWPNVVFLSGFEGTDAGQDAVDESSAANAITWNGAAQSKTLAAIYGATGLLLPGAADYLSLADSANFNFGSAPFTIEGTFSFDSTGNKSLIRQWETGQQSFWFRVTSTTIQLLGSSNGTTVATLASGAWSHDTFTPHHLAADFDGTTYRVYVDGVVKGSGATVITLFDSSAEVRIGSTNGTSNGFTGSADEIRITKGVARYAGAFTPPSAAFPRS